MSIDVIGNFLTIIRNAVKINKRIVTLPSSILKINIAQVLKEEGYIKDLKIEEDEAGKKRLTIYLKYVDGKSAINQISRVSTPGCRRYERSGSIKEVIGGLGISILSTSKGVMTDRHAKKISVGGEVLCHVW